MDRFAAGASYHDLMGSIPGAPQLARNVKRVSRLELPGAGQVTIEGKYAYVGHITNKERLGTSILDVSDPLKPKLVSQIAVEEPESHSHKARVIGDVMIVNVEQNMGKTGRAGVDGPAEQTSYAHGGFPVIDIKAIRKPNTLGAYNYHPPYPEPSHTFMPIKERIGNRRIAVAIDEEDHAHSADEMERRRGRPHGCLWVMDVTKPAEMRPLALYEVSELDSPWSRATPGR